ncbi:MAG: TetR/AcrR family transcriptional regulator [Myxococcota bacterium]
MARPIDTAARAAQRRIILEAAGRLFAENGFHQTGMAAICREAGMSPGGLYRYFGSKAALIEGIVAQERAEVLTLLDALEATDDLRSGLVDLLLACATAALDPHATALTLEVAAEGARNPSVGAMVDEVYQAFSGRLAAMLRAAQDRGAVPSDVDPTSAALILAAAADGLSASAAGREGLSPNRLRSSLERVVDGLLS